MLKVSKHIPDEYLSIKGYDVTLPIRKRRARGMAVGAVTGTVLGMRTANSVSVDGHCRVSINGIYRSTDITVTKMAFPDGTESIGAVLLVRGL